MRVAWHQVTNSHLHIAAVCALWQDCYSQPIYSQLGCSCYLMNYFANTCTSPIAFCKACQKNYPKPLNTGASKLPKTVRWGSRDGLGFSNEMPLPTCQVNHLKVPAGYTCRV